ncbi:MAG: methyltransferase [Pseudomonadota bacterium]
MSPFLELFAVLAAFAVFHLSTSSPQTAAAVQRKTGLSAGAYAGARAALSLSLLIGSLVILLGEAPSTTPFFQPIMGAPALFPSLFAFWLAGGALTQVAKARRLPQFFGFQPYPKLFIFTGAYAVCRHPMYTGWLIAGWGLMISQPFLLTAYYNVLVTCFVVALALLEERRMVDLFGDRYRAYRNHVPFLLPYGFLKGTITWDDAPPLK